MTLMRRRARRLLHGTLPASVLAVGLTAAVIVVVGCGTRTAGDRPSGGAAPPLGDAQQSADNAGAKAAADGKLFQDWPKPVGALIISGEQRGYLEPCGCTAGQRGGLARRLDLVQRLRAQDWPLALIDLGSLSNDPNTMGGPDETRIRFSTALRALEMIGYDAFGLSVDDLKLGVDEFIIRLLNHQGPKLKAVSANVLADSALGLQDRLVTAVRTKAGPVDVGITSVVAPDAFMALNDPNKAAMLSYRDPEEALNEVLAELERDTHIQVLLAQGPPEFAKRLAHAHKGFEVVVATSPYVDPPTDAEVLNDGKTQLITVGRKGQYVGVLALYQSSDPKQRFRYHRRELGSRFNGKTEAMRKLIDEDFQTDLRDANVLGTYPKRPYVFTDSPTNAEFVGAETCRQCHPNTYAKWSSTNHAKAYNALTNDPRDPKRNREFDAQCISCHTTGFEYLGGFTSVESTPHLKGNQCENCHGPGGEHVADPTNAAIRQAIHRDATDFEKNHRCIKCHSEDDSPHFDFGKYWPKVMHKGLDRYDDPKVREGIKPAQVARKPKP